MADATLIQGARELAAAKSGVAPGAAFSAGVQKAQANAAANAAAQNKANMESFDASQKYLKEYALKGITSLTGGSKSLTEGDMKNATKILNVNRSMLSEGALRNSDARRRGSYEGVSEATNIGEKAKANSVQLYDQMSMLEKVREQYVALNLLKENGETSEIAKLPGNVERMKQMDTLLSSDWDMKDGALTFADGTRLIDMKLPFTTEIGKEFMEYAGQETKAMGKFTKSVPPPSTVTAGIKSNIEEYFEGDEGLNRLEVLTSENYFKELNSGFNGINLDRNNPDEARKKAAELTYNAILGGVKPDKVTEGKDNEDTKGVNNPNYSSMKKLQEDYLATPPLNRAARYGKDDLVFTLGSKNTEAVLKKDGWYIQSKQPDGTVYMTKYDNVEDLLERNSNLFN